MIFGLGPFPEMGIRGAALATGIGQVLTVLIYLAACLLRPLPVHIRGRLLKPDRGMAGRLYAVGIPATLNLALPSLLISALNGILAVYSEIYVLILGVYYKLQTFLYLPASGVVQGMRPIIGYNYGAGEKKRVKQIYRSALVMNLLIMALGTGICLAVPDRLMGLFSQNPETIRQGAPGSADHLRRVYCFLGVRNRFRSPGRPGKGYGFPGDLPLPVRGGDHPGGFSPQPVPGGGGRMERLLGHGSRVRGRRLGGVSQDSAKKRDSVNLILTDACAMLNYRPISPDAPESGSNRKGLRNNGE